jgi:hypothetical protein
VWNCSVGPWQKTKIQIAKFRKTAFTGKKKEGTDAAGLAQWFRPGFLYFILMTDKIQKKKHFYKL